MQQLIPQELLSILPNLYETENTKDPICHIKLFTPDSNWTFYILEFSKEDQNTLFTYTIGHESELGYQSLEELSSICGPLGLKIELDSSFTPRPLSEVKKLHS